MAQRTDWPRRPPGELCQRGASPIHPARMMTAVAAMTLLLKVAASACPDATWTAAPAGVSSSWLSTCYKSSEAVSNLAECFDACAPGRPACLSSAEETRFILEFVPFGNTWEESGIHFIGDRLTNTDTASLQCDGSPSAPWLTNAEWEHGLGKYHGCAFMVPTGGFGSSYEPSDGSGMRFYNTAATLFEVKIPCLCAQSSVVATASAKNETLAWVVAQQEEMVSDATTWAIVLLALMGLLVLLPSVYIWVRYMVSRSTGDANGESPSDTKSMLRDASSSAARVRVRVSGALFWLGWLLIVVSLVPDLANNIAKQVLSEDGLLWALGVNPDMLLPAMAWGVCLMLLSILPTDVSAIRCVPFVLLVIFCFLFLVFATSAVSHSSSIDFVHPMKFWFIMIAWIYQTILVVTLICFLLRTIRCCCCESHRMTPRAALNRMWLTLRCLLIATAVPPIAYVICATLADDFGHDAAGTGGLIIYAVSFALAGVTFKPANRGRIRRFLGSLGAKGTSEQEAAAIAALVGGRSPAETLSLATSKFRMLTTDQLEVSDLASSKDTGMYARTKRAALGECAAFLSHSWQDDGVAKYDALNAWSIRQEAGERSIWLDKACIDQHANIDDQLVALPIFLSGCKQLLIIAGPTYTSRLWCTMEVFTFVRMNGGQHQNIIVEPIAGQTLQILAKFDGGKAQCFDPEDRSHLLAVIESGMGDIRHLNRMVGAIFTAKARGAGLQVLSEVTQGRTDSRQPVHV